MRVLLVGAELEENLAIRYLAAALEARRAPDGARRVRERGDTDDVQAAVASGASGARRACR